MKKFLTIAAVALVAMSMQAAQINWGLTGGQIKYNGTNVGNGGATFTLVCLEGVADWATYANEVALGATDGVAATKTTNAGSMSQPTASPYKFGFGEATDITNGTIKDGTEFAFMVTYKDGADTYFWASDAFAVSESSSNYDAPNWTYTMSDTVANAMGATGTNWTKAVAVPEPASAMLALAGVAMLIRRRK